MLGTKKTRIGREHTEGKEKAKSAWPKVPPYCLHLIIHVCLGGRSQPRSNRARGTVARLNSMNLCSATQHTVSLGSAPSLGRDKPGDGQGESGEHVTLPRSSLLQNRDAYSLECAFCRSLSHSASCQQER